MPFLFIEGFAEPTNPLLKGKVELPFQGAAHL